MAQDKYATFVVFNVIVHYHVVTYLLTLNADHLTTLN